jgi:hypothetical protein
MQTKFASQIPSDVDQLEVWCSDKHSMIKTLIELGLLPERNDCTECYPTEYDTMELVKDNFRPNGYIHECQSCWDTIPVTEGSWFLEELSLDV